ncbi:hypothetical protein ColTof3_14851 [Colletotrichum tofieldiae]|nr:hypothetical protein ColTof3_14851 [Colletotrichum tofieldiae]
MHSHSVTTVQAMCPVPMYRNNLGLATRIVYKSAAGRFRPLHRVGIVGGRGAFRPLSLVFFLVYVTRVVDDISWHDSDTFLMQLDELADRVWRKVYWIDKALDQAVGINEFSAEGYTASRRCCVQ